jgi:hypothetical protein
MPELNYESFDLGRSKRALVKQILQGQMSHAWVRLKFRPKPSGLRGKEGEKMCSV